MNKILLIDNYDSFSYNLVHMVENILHTRIDVWLNDRITLEIAGAYDKIILSPGPGLPNEAGMLIPVLQEYAAKKSILGICLGHQAMAEVFGAKLQNLTEVYHGVATTIKVIHSDTGLFKGMGTSFLAGRYHSWIVDSKTLPSDLEITAVDSNEQIMGLSHKNYDLQSVQFHPESILTPHGEQILRNWLIQ